MIETITTLDELYSAMRSGDDVGPWDSLPTFGGDDVEHTDRVWSWDARRMIVGTCADDLEIVPRLDVIVAYRVQHSHGATEEHDTYEQALAGLRGVYGSEIEVEGDPDDVHARVLVWSDAEAAENDDGARAVASVKPLLAEPPPVLDA